MSVVTLVSGGLDSTVMAVLCQQSGVQQFPVFVNYGQRSFSREFAACQKSLRRLRLPEPVLFNIAGFGKALPSGLTSSKFDIVADAWLPNRNLLLLLCGTSYAAIRGADAVAVGLLQESTHLFPDQTDAMINASQLALSASLGRPIKIICPLRMLDKPAVIEMAKRHNITQTYSCHSGFEQPCGVCISCREFGAQEGKWAAGAVAGDDGHPKRLRNSSHRRKK